jgi:hypothetical protein
MPGVGFWDYLSERYRWGALGGFLFGAVAIAGGNPEFGVSVVVASGLIGLLGLAIGRRRRS